MDERVSPQFDVSDSTQAALIDGARDVQPVSGLTHNFYRYPARFSPTFVRAVIEAFTEPGDYVLDPYFGGGRAWWKQWHSGETRSEWTSANSRNS